MIERRTIKLLRKGKRVSYKCVAIGVSTLHDSVSCLLEACGHAGVVQMTFFHGLLIQGYRSRVESGMGGKGRFLWFDLI